MDFHVSLEPYREDIERRWTRRFSGTFRSRIITRRLAGRSITRALRIVVRYSVLITWCVHGVRQAKANLKQHDLVCFFLLRSGGPFLNRNEFAFFAPRTRNRNQNTH
jgi:hypothetical protein